MLSLSLHLLVSYNYLIAPEKYCFVPNGPNSDCPTKETANVIQVGI